MNGKISKFFSVSLLVAAFGCQGVDPVAVSDNDTALEFKSATVTKALMDGEDIYNENTIRRIDVFFYPMGGTGSDALLHRRFNFTQTEGVDGVVNAKVYLNEGKLTQLSAGVRRCEAYTIANLPENYSFTDSNPANTSMAQLQALALQGNFRQNMPSGFPGGNITFVMHARDTIQFSTSSNALVATGTIHNNGPIELSRVAAKVNVHVVVEPEITVSTTSVIGNVEITTEHKWIPISLPLADNLKVYLNNAYDYATVGGASTPITAASELFNYPSRTTVDRGAITLNVDNNPVTFENSYYAEPFYTYPMTWSYGTKQEPYIKVEQVWGHVKMDTEGNYMRDAQGNYITDQVKKFYYKVFFPINEFKRNNWYEVGVHLGLLGSETDETSLVLEDSYYYVVPWSNGYTGNSGIAEIPGSVGSARYLQVHYSSDSNGYINVYNQNLLTIPYVTSHDCEIVNVSASYDDYSQINKRSVSIPTSTASSWLSLSGGEIHFNHILNNDIESTDVNVGAYYIEFDIRHKDNPSFYKHVKIVQYPAMYITSQLSNGWVFVNNRSNSSSQNVRSDWNDDIGSVVARNEAISGTTNANPNLYTIHVSVLNDSQMYIADTRGDEAAMSHFNSGKLDYYKATRSDAGFAVSPEFIVASSYGKTTPMTFENAQRRCAAYQEAGYPQGRWRLPSPGEIQFCVMLSNYGKIPSLFTGQYWAANGQFYSTEEGYPSGNGMNNNPYVYVGFNTDPRTNARWWVRCVYDTWAWGQEPVQSALYTARWSQQL